MKKEIRKVVLRGATVEYLENEDINVCPTRGFAQRFGWGGRQVDLSSDCKGRMKTEPDGTCHFQAYRRDTGSRYQVLYTTANGELKRTRRMLIVRMAIPIGIGSANIIETLWRQIQEMVGYIALKMNQESRERELPNHKN